MLAGLFVLACGGSQQPGRLLTQLIEDDPARLVAASLFDDHEVFSWHFDGRTPLDVYTLHDLAPLRPVNGVVSLEPSSPDPFLIRQVALEAAAIDVIEVTVRGGRRGAMELFWAGPDEAFSGDRRLALDGESLPGQDGRWAFEVGQHPAWGGTIERLRLDPTNRMDDVVSLAGIRGLDRRASPDRLAEALLAAHKVELAADLRNVWLAPPGVPRDVPITSRADAGPTRVHVGYGLEAGVTAPVTFRVRGTPAAGGEAEATLFEDRLEAADAGRWHETSFALPPGASGVRFETESAATLDLVRGFPLWATPMVVAEQGTERVPPSVVVISLDTLRADRLSSYGHDRPTSPRLDRWARERAVRFANVVAASPWTLPSHVSMFSGLDAVAHGVNHVREAPDDISMLAERLREAGYATAAITGGGYLRPPFGFAQGFDRFAYWPEIMADDELENGLARLEAWIDTLPRPFFLFFHTYEIHYPHRRRQPYFDRLAGTAIATMPDITVQMRGQPWDMEALRRGGDYFVSFTEEDPRQRPHLDEDGKALVEAMYDSAIAYVDDQLFGRLLPRLEGGDLEGNVLLTVTSDHGEALGEDDRAGHAYLEDYNVMVPWLLALPGERGARWAGRVVDEQVRAVDLTPTVLAALDLPVPREDGVSVLPVIEGHAEMPDEAWSYNALTNVGLSLRVRNRFKYRFNNAAWQRVHGEERLFDLRRDPLETRDLHADPEQASTFASMRARAEATLDARHAGLRIEIANGEGEALHGSLRGAWAKVAQLKQLRAGCPCIRWAGDGAGFVLDPDTSLALVAEPPVGGSAWIELARGTDGAEVVRIDLDASTRPLLIEPLEGPGAGWRQRLVDADATTGVPVERAALGVTVWRAGPGVGAATDMAPTADPALAEQLRALGYID